MAKRPAGEKQVRRSIDYDVSKPPLLVTDPDAADAQAEGKPMDREYPKHLARAEEGGAREVVSADDAEDEKEKRAQGFMTHQELDVAQAKAKPAPKFLKSAAKKAKAAPAKKAKAKPAKKAPAPASVPVQ